MKLLSTYQLHLDVDQIPHRGFLIFNFTGTDSSLTAHGVFDGIQIVRSFQSYGKEDYCYFVLLGKVTLFIHTMQHCCHGRLNKTHRTLSGLATDGPTKNSTQGIMFNYFERNKPWQCWCRGRDHWAECIHPDVVQSPVESSRLCSFALDRSWIF